MAFEYRKGQRMKMLLPLDSVSADIVIGVGITAAGATGGYFKEVDGLGEALVGISCNIVASPSADGGAYVLVDVSEDSVYEVGPDAGSVTAVLAMSTADVGADGLTVNIDGSATDDIAILTADATNNKMHVRLKLALPGVA
jgi:hypothetical protein